MISSINHNEMRNANEKLVLQQIFNHRLISRTQIAKNSGLHKSTISSIFDTLFERKLILDVGEGESTNVGGRKPSLISFNDKYGYLISFDIGRRHLRMATFYMNGCLESYKSFSIVKKSGKQILSLMKKLVTSNTINDTLFGLQGIGLSVHGVVFQNKIIYSPFVDFAGIDLYAELKMTFDVEIILENEANLSAIYLRDYVKHKVENSFESFISINIHNGIGVGIVINNQLYRGMSGSAGEYGRSIVIGASGKQLTENLFSEDALVNQAAEQVHKKNLDRDKFLKLYEKQDPDIVAITAMWTNNIARIIYNLFQIFAPEALYVNSRIIFKESTIFEQLKKDLAALHSPVPTHLVEPTKDVEYSTLYGAAALTTRLALGLDDDFELSFTEDTSVV